MKPYYQNKLVTIYHGNCLDILPELDKVDLVLTSPPYDKLRDYKGYIFDFEKTARAISKIIKMGGVIVWIVGDQTIDGSETGTSFKYALYFKQIGLNLHDTMIYQKDGCPYPETTRYYPEFEYMFIFSLGKPKTVNLIADKPNSQAGVKLSGSTDRQKNGSTKPKSFSKCEPNRKTKDFGIRGNVWRYSPGYMKSTKFKLAYDHPAIFPEALARDHIISWTNENDILLDPCAGSGTSLVEGGRLNRKCIGIEIEEKYCEIAAKRCEEARTGLTPAEQDAGYGLLFKDE